VTCCAFWALLNEGFLDELHEKGELALDEYARGRNLDPSVLTSICEYLDVVKVLDLKNGRCSLGPLGETFLQEPRGTFDLLFGYEPVFFNLGGLLAKKKIYGKDVARRGDFIAKGSGELGVQLPFPMMTGFAKQYGVSKVLDLGCGDLEFLFALCREVPQARCWGIDNSEDAVNYARQKLSGSDCASRIQLAHLDMFDIDGVRGFAPDVDGITAVDVFHEYLSDGPERIREYLSRLKDAFGGARLLVAEFCRQPHERLKKNPTGFLEHEFFHNLTNQTILPADDWVRLFRNAGFKIVDKQVFDLVGHGYFVLE
jgi:hypothetical protein